jgi:hypothetical protein
VYYKQSLNNPELDYPQTKMISDHSHHNRRRGIKLPGKVSDQKPKNELPCPEDPHQLSSSTTQQVPKAETE